MHVALLTDYSVVAFANGPSLATQALKRHLENRGHRVTIVGPRPGKGAPAAAPGSLLLESAPFHGHAGVQLPFAWPPQAFANREKFDVVHSHANSSLMHWGPMMRDLHGIPCLSTNTVYIPGFARYGLSPQLYKIALVRELWEQVAAKRVEASVVKAYNAGDGLIVQCQGLADYWANLGLEVPLHVIPRPIDTAVFDAPLGPDPFRPDFARGKRIVSVSRHAREKDIDKVVEAFAHHVLPRHPDASLTLVGDGQAHRDLVRLAASLGVATRVDFPGEKPHKDTRHYYGHADVFAYASMTETYGQVISEALWCGVPVVATDDSMGVAFQVVHERDGLLTAPGDAAVAALGEGVSRLLDRLDERRHFGAHAARRARARVAPSVVYRQYELAYESAGAHLKRSLLRRPHQGRKPDWWRLTNRHLLPWTVQQSLLLAMGAFHGKPGDYAMPNVAIDALPTTGHQDYQEAKVA